MLELLDAKNIQYIHISFFEFLDVQVTVTFIWRIRLIQAKEKKAEICDFK